MTNVIKAKRAQVQLGDQTLDVFQLPDGSYRISAKQVTETIGIRHSRVAEVLATKQGLALTQQGLRVAEKTPLTCNDAGNISGYSLETAAFVWQFEGNKGNKLAQALSFACIIESLERRADEAFEVIRTEEERNKRFQTRLDGIVSRNFWTDVVEAYTKTHDVSDSYKKFVYINVSDRVNRSLFGLSSKQIRKHYDLRKGDSVRDFLPSDTVKLIDCIEKAAGVRVRNNDVCPKQALKDVIAVLGIEPDADRL